MYRSKYISKGAVDLIFSPDVGNNPSYPYIQRKQNKTNKFRNSERNPAHQSKLILAVQYQDDEDDPNTATGFRD